MKTLKHTDFYIDTLKEKIENFEPLIYTVCVLQKNFGHHFKITQKELNKLSEKVGESVYINKQDLICRPKQKEE